MGPESTKMLYKEGKIYRLTGEYDNIYEANEKVKELENSDDITLVQRTTKGRWAVYHRPKDHWQ